LLQGHAMTMIFKVGTQMLRATRRLNMVVISVKLFQNLTSNNEFMGRTRMGRTDGRTDGRPHRWTFVGYFFCLKLPNKRKPTQ